MVYINIGLIYITIFWVSTLVLKLDGASLYVSGILAPFIAEIIVNWMEKNDFNKHINNRNKRNRK